jgi:hypothetical protein
MKEKPDWLVEYEETLDDGQTVVYQYDKEGDILEVFFQRGGGCGVELTDEIVLRYNVKTGKPLSLIFLCFSALMQSAEFGPPNFRLKLEEMPNDVRQTVLEIITTPPVNRFLKVLTYSPPRAKRPVPITYVERLPALALAQKEIA